jgi:hypothetical protein
VIREDLNWKSVLFDPKSSTTSSWTAWNNRNKVIWSTILLCKRFHFDASQVWLFALFWPWEKKGNIDLPPGKHSLLLGIVQFSVKHIMESKYNEDRIKDRQFSDFLFYIQSNSLSHVAQWTRWLMNGEEFFSL